MSNQQVMERVADAVENFATAGYKETVRVVRGRVVRRTPKRTQHAAGWMIGIGGWPSEPPQDKPSQSIYPLFGDADTERELAGYRLPQGDVVLASRATYIKWLNLGKSPQAPAHYIEDELTQSAPEVAAWRWDGKS